MFTSTTFFFFFSSVRLNENRFVLAMAWGSSRRGKQGDKHTHAQTGEQLRVKLLNRGLFDSLFREEMASLVRFPHIVPDGPHI